MKNLRTDHEVEVRCAKFLKAMENRVAKLENEIKNKVDESKVRELIDEAKLVNEPKVRELAKEAFTGIEDSGVAAMVEESVNQKVTDMRDSTMREKNIIIHGVQESPSEEGQQRKDYDNEFVSKFFNYLEGDCENVKKVIRLGARKHGKDNIGTNSRPRPIRITMCDVDAKQRL